MRRVIIESPYAGPKGRNIAYARRCLRDSLIRWKEAPFASHLIYTQPNVLSDNDAYERTKGIEAGTAWLTVADALIVYTDLGITEGMRERIKLAEQSGTVIEYRSLNGVPNTA